MNIPMFTLRSSNKERGATGSDSTLLMDKYTSSNSDSHSRAWVSEKCVNCCKKNGNIRKGWIMNIMRQNTLVDDKKLVN